jgi:uncharacterized membrane protein
MSTMYSKVKLAGHPIHPMLVAFPVTFYTTTLIGFVAYALTDNLFWWHVGLWSNVAGVVTAVVAALPGMIDWAIGIPKNSMAKATGLKHMLLNLGALTLFLVNLLVHRNAWMDERVVMETGVTTGSEAAVVMESVVVAPDPRMALILSALGFLLTLFAGFLGWSLVQTHHVGIELSEEQKRLEPRTGTPTRPMVQS